MPEHNYAVDEDFLFINGRVPDHVVKEAWGPTPNRKQGKGVVVPDAVIMTPPKYDEARDQTVFYFCVAGNIVESYDIPDSVVLQAKRRYGSTNSLALHFYILREAKEAFADELKSKGYKLATTQYRKEYRDGGCEFLAYA